MLALGAGLFVSACGDIGLKLANLPAKFSHVSVQRNVPYGDDPLQTMDIYKAPEKENAPVVVFFYGGRWTDGKKENYAFVGNHFAKQGYTVIIPDYRKYPSVKFPAFVNDAAAAIAWAQNHIRPDLYVMGHSAGAHIGALAVADPKYLKKAGGNAGKIIAFAGLAGPYDFTPKAADLKDMFGPPEHYEKMQVTTFITGTEPPMFLLYGGQDDLVDKSNMTKLAKAIEQKGGRVQTKTYPDYDHITLMASLTWMIDRKNQVANDILEFFRKASRAR